MDPATPSTIYAGVSGNGTNAAVFKSTNDAASWSPSSTGLPNATLLAVVMDPQNPSTLYAATANGLYVTNDGGTGWSATQVSGSVTAVAVSPTPGTSTIYAAGIVGLQRNSGSGWTTVLSQPGISAIAVMPDDPAVVYAATQTTIWRSADAGGTWRSLTTAGLPQLNVNALLPGSPLLIANVSSVFACSRPPTTPPSPKEARWPSSRTPRRPAAWSRTTSTAIPSPMRLWPTARKVAPSSRTLRPAPTPTRRTPTPPAATRSPSASTTGPPTRTSLR